MEADRSSVLAQRAASEGPRWTRAEEDQSPPTPENNEQAWEGEKGAVRLSFLLAECAR
jgi:hypothetical protein